MRNRRIQIILSCLIGLMVGILYLRKITSVRREIEGLQDAVKIVAARTSLRMGDQLLRDHLRAVAIPRPYLPRRAVYLEDMEKIISRSLIHPIPAGDPILWTDLPEGPRIRYPTEGIPSGFRAMALPADEVNTLSHLLIPGDRVDMVWTHFATDSDVASSEILVEDTPILAVGRRLSAETSENPEDSFPASITFLLKPADSLRILSALQGGGITLLARGEGHRPEARTNQDSPTGKISGHQGNLP